MSEKIGVRVGIDGEKEFKQALSGINSDLKVLDSELKKTTAEFADNSNSMEALTEKGTILNKQLEKQKEKVEALKLALENSQKQYGENDTRTDKWKISLNNAEAEMSKLTKDININNDALEKAKTVTNKTADSIDDFGKEMDSANDKTLSFGDVLKANLASDVIVEGVKSLGRAIKDTAKSTVELVTGTAAYADDMLTLSTQTGISTDKLQAYNYMAELTDTSLETLTSSMAKNIKSMSNAQNGSAKYVKAYNELNVAFEDGNHNLRDSESVYWDVIDALKGVSDETQRDSIAMQLFGKSAQELNTLIDQGSAGVNKFTEEAKSMGAILDEDTLSSLGETDDALQRMNQSVEIAKRRIGAEMAPAVTEAFEKITDKVTNMDGEFAAFAGGALNAAVDGLSWVADNAGIIAGGISGIAIGMAAFKAGSAIETGLTKAVDGWIAYKKVTEGATVAQYALNVAQNLSPVGVLATAVGALTAGLVIYNTTSGNSSDKTSKFSKELKESLNASDDLNDSIRESIKARKENNDKIDSEYGTLKNLSDRLFDLSKKENLSNSEKTQMVSLVKSLNDSLPGLNLTLDEETGILNKQQEQVNGLINANMDLYKVKAAQQDLIKIAQEQYDAEKKVTDLEKEYKEACEASNKVNELTWKGWIHLTDAEKEYVNDHKNATDAFVEVGEKLYDTKENLSKLKDEWNETQDYIGDHSDIDSTAESVDEFGNKVDKSTQKATESLDELKKAYKDAKNSAEDSIESQIDIFSKFSDKTDLTKDKLLKNLKSQLNGIEDWSENLQSLSDRGINKGLLKDLKNMGPSAAAEIALLNSMSDKELKEYSKTWGKLGKATEKAADISVSALKDKYDKAYKQQKSDAKTAVEGTVKSYNQGIIDNYESVKNVLSTSMRKSLEQAESENKSNANFIGASITEGIAEGAKSKKGSLNLSILNLVDSMLSSTKKKLGIHSPSKVMKEEVGEQLANGVVEGIESKKKYAKKSASELGEIIVDAAQKKLDNYKVYHNLTLKEEVDFWDKIRKETKKGTQSRIDADKEYYDKKKELLESQKNLENDYKDNIKSINKELVEDIKSATDSYNDAITSRADTIKDSLNLFEEYKPEESPTGEELLNNLNSQVVGLAQWRANLDNLDSRGIDKNLLKELQGMGISASEEIAALNTMTDNQLDEYVGLWKDKSQAAKDEAVSELEDLNKETNKRIKELKKQAKEDIKEYSDDYLSGLKKLGKSSKLKAKEIGEAIGDGIAEGATSKTEKLNNAISGLAKSMLTTIKKDLGIHSPSKVFAEIGKYSAEGFGIGFEDSMTSVNKNMAKAISREFEVNGKANTSNNLSGNISGGQQLILQIENFNNNTKDDVEALMNDMAFYAKRKSGGGGIVLGQV